jgi:hypothetical protein
MKRGHTYFLDFTWQRMKIKSVVPPVKRIVLLVEHQRKNTALYFYAEPIYLSNPECRRRSLTALECDTGGDCPPAEYGDRCRLHLCC